ncbi:cytochrome d ubiquinol oxidase subunit II [Oryzomonas japonica]|uniref:Cytochrome d ubiquinol oxidase subunit II n=1 Tax=Oryzomonas japonica TaxID=2603858 RepID=A0A7J4ZM90_9BACT|nr:cytochrome d ubiquinol oxidase subunit II [Oryzomonas japonica]KAB0663814.1 cytochrome d ubiquinol oxidase subunit II [Oryzomonas japonica]
MWTLENLAAGAVYLGLVMYAVFGGADFGGGVWTAFASGPRAREQRNSLFHAIGPVWETNHVWLIFVVVALFTGFPKGFAAMFTVLLFPLVIALIGINFRGAAFAFRHFGRQTGEHIPFMVSTFAVSSILAPFALGMAVTATATGKIVIADGRVQAEPWFWIDPFTLVGGLAAVAICAYLAPIYMTVRTEGALRKDFRRQGIIAGLVLGILTAAEIPVAMAHAPLFASRLLAPRGITFVALSVIGGITTQILLWRCRFPWAQIAAVGTVTLTISGFAAAMYPDLLMGQLSIVAAAAPSATLRAFFLVLVIGIVILAPSLLLLYWTFRGEPNPELPQ